MPPRLTPRTMLWTGLALAVVGELLRSVLLPRVMFSVPVPLGVLEAASVLLHVVFTGGIVLAGGSFVVRALQPDDPPRKEATPVPWEDRDNRLS
ncbi:hypothetical protein ACFVSK_00425 [Cellulosimicrobium cellulans]|uniref:hypothetical protein n=1 Tax=Cellulosimicrobium cellulans TaxID=1710 RepID=UPI0036E49989